MGGFFDMNFSQIYPEESIEESIKQTMLNQEIIFKKQVHELHHLYEIQKSLMKGDGISIRPFSNYTRFDLLPLKRTFSETPTRRLDLRLSTGNFCDDDDVLGEEEVNLSLSIGMSANKRSRNTNKITYPLSQDIIDLEESIETSSNEDAKHVLSLDQSSLNSSDHLKRDPCRKMTESLMNGSNVHQEWSFFDQGSNEWHGVKQIISMDFDLNKDQPDESSFHSNGTYPSSGSSSGESCTRIIKPIGDSTSSTPLTFDHPKSQSGTKALGNKSCTIDLESMPEPLSDLSEEKETPISEVSEETEKKVNRSRVTSDGQKSTESDYMVQKAALSLICIKDSVPKSGSNEKKRRPHCSSSIDSYESLVLKLEESSIDVDSVKSNVFDMNEFDKKESGIKLRRGRRMKDFQKDILPTLSSLSRQEIWEDVKIMEGVIRSREYKRLQKMKTGNAENWFTPVRSRRSTVKYVGQRYKKVKS